GDVGVAFDGDAAGVDDDLAARDRSPRENGEERACGDVHVDRERVPGKVERAGAGAADIETEAGEGGVAGELDVVEGILLGDAGVGDRADAADARAGNNELAGLEVHGGVVGDAVAAEIERSARSDGDSAAAGVAEGGGVDDLGGAGIEVHGAGERVV